MVARSVAAKKEGDAKRDLRGQIGTALRSQLAKVGGVESVTLAAPVQDVICSDTQIPQLADVFISLNVSD